MRVQTTAFVSAATLVWAAVADDSASDPSLPTNVGEPSCSCAGVCNIRGDPHITDFYGETWLQSVSEGDELNLYTIPSAQVSVTAVIKNNNWVGEIVVKSSGSATESFNADNCTSGKTFSAQVKDVANGTVSVETKCQKKNGEWHLDTFLTRDESSGLDFKAEETKLGSTGVCQQGAVSRRRLRSLSSSDDQITCTCSSACKAIGDPHLYSFYNYYEEMPASEFSPSDISGELSTLLLKDKKSGFEIVAYVNEGKNMWIRDVKFGSNVRKASSMCTSIGQTYQYTKTLHDGSTTLTLYCRSVKKSDGFFWDTYIEKVDTNISSQSGSATFQSIEEADGNTGECYRTN